MNYRRSLFIHLAEQSGFTRFRKRNSESCAFSMDKMVKDGKDVYFFPIYTKPKPKIWNAMPVPTRPKAANKIGSGLLGSILNPAKKATTKPKTKRIKPKVMTGDRNLSALLEFIMFA
jgi:hypothetical protein